MTKSDPPPHALWFLPINVFPVIQWLLRESSPELFHQGYFFHPKILANFLCLFFKKGRGGSCGVERKLLQGPKHFKSMEIIRRICSLYPSLLTNWGVDQLQITKTGFWKQSLILCDSLSSPCGRNKAVICLKCLPWTWLATGTQQSQRLGNERSHRD